MSTSVQHGSPIADRWLARLALGTLAVAALLPLAAAGWRGILLPIVVAAQLALVVVGLWLALAHRGAVRVFGLLLALAAVVVVTALEIRANLLWVVIVAAALLVSAADEDIAERAVGMLRANGFSAYKVSSGSYSSEFTVRVSNAQGAADRQIAAASSALRR